VYSKEKLKRDVSKAHNKSLKIVSNEQLSLVIRFRKYTRHLRVLSIGIMKLSTQKGLSNTEDSLKILATLKKMLLGT
jgi:hypothetical protein